MYHVWDAVIESVQACFRSFASYEGYSSGLYCPSLAPLHVALTGTDYAKLSY